MNNCCQTNELTPKPAADQVEHYQPDVDVFENDEEFIMVVDVPGTTQESLEVEFEKGRLTIKAKASARQKPEAKYALNEFGVADYYRSFEFGEKIDPESLTAEFALGVLTITLKKAAAQTLRRIPIN